MKVSVIIPVYNEEKTIGKCLVSLFAQTYNDTEIIIVDDGSDDRTIDVIEGQLNKLTYKNLSLYRQDHKGAGVARNLGAKHAKGEILVFVDADMTFDPDFIEKLVEPIQKGHTIGTFSKEEYLANADNVWAKCWNINRGFPPDKMHTKHYPDRQKVFRAILKDEFERAGGFDEKAGYIDDWSISERLGIEAQAASGAIFYHANPDSLNEVFTQSKWMAKRRYKLGLVGVIVALIRVSLPLSLIIGMLYAVRHKLYAFLPFKIISDFGQFLGIIEFNLGRKVSK